MDQSHQLSTSPICRACPLDRNKAEIRLLKLELEHGPTRALRCAFYNASLDDHGPPFTAISYAWDRGEYDRLLNVGLTVIRVTKTVENVLRGVLANEAAFVWIDQVSIDQGIL